MKKTLHSKEYERLTGWLKQSRVERGLSIRSLAKLLDVPHSFVGKIEQGERRLDVIEYVEYCRALGIQPNKGLQTAFSKTSKPK